MRLLAIPRTAVRGPESRNRGDKLVERWMIGRISVSVERAVGCLGARFGVAEPAFAFLRVALFPFSFFENTSIPAFPT